MKYEAIELPVKIGLHTFGKEKMPPLDPSVVDVSHITEYGLTQKLSTAVRCF
jgi:hypothetical protein